MRIEEKHFVIKTMLPAELDIAINWAAQEGWNPGLHDRDCFFAADADGFLMGVLDGTPIGCISAVTYGSTYGFIGFYIVIPEYRGQGLGIQLWRAAMERLAGRNVGLDGVVAQQANYQKSNFTLAYRNIRYVAAVPPKYDQQHQGITPLNKLSFDQIVAYDAAIFGIPRPAFLRAWISQPAGAALGLIHDGRLTGYGVIRPCREGSKIGPLFADDAASAAILYASLANTAANGPVYLDVPEINTAAMALASSHAMQKVFETARMYLQPCPPLPLDKVFGITTFELG